MKCSLVSLIFLKRSLVFPILLFSSIYLHWSLRKFFLSLLAILWDSAFNGYTFDCGSDHEPLIAKFRLKLNKIGKTTRPFRYDLNQITYDYTVEVTNRFKGLDLIYWVTEELWMEVHDILQEAVIKTIPNEKKCKKAKWLSEEALQIAVKEEKWKAKEKRKDTPVWMQSSKNSKER